MADNNEFESISEEELDKELAKLTLEYNEIKAEDEADEESLTTLALEEREIMAALMENRRKQQDIKTKRYNRRGDIVKKDREVKTVESQLIEKQRIRQHEDAKASEFTRMVADARDAGYAWVEYAKPHQWEGGMTIAHYGSAVLGDGTGTGKTLTAIMSMDFAKHKTVLVVTPADVVSSFAEEILFFAPHRNVVPLEGANPKYRKLISTILESSAEYVVVINYESLWRESKWLGKFHWDAIYIDEAHNMKNESGLTFDALSQFDYDQCIPMTATSILNEPGDIWTSLNMIDPARFTSKYNFLNIFCMQDADGKWVFKPGGEKALMAQLKGRILKRTLEEVAPNLPKQTVNEVVIPELAVSEAQLKIMHQIHNFNGIMLDNGESTRMDAIIAAITRERQAAVFPAGIEVKMTQKMFDEWFQDGPPPAVGTVLFSVPKDVPSVKLDLAEDKLARMVKAGKRCVVFSQFKTALVDLEARLNAKGIRVVRYDGDTDKGTRLAVKRDFLRPASGIPKADFRYDVVLANYKTGGVGLTFTEATYMLCLDEEWNPAKNHQAWARIHRIGQTEETTVDILRIEKSIDMWMKSLNEKKQAIVNGFEAEIDTVASLKDYFTREMPTVEETLTQIEKHEIDLDDEFLTLLEDIE